MKAKIHITLKTGVLDPQGKAIEGALCGLGFAGVDNVRQGKFIELEISESDPTKAREQIEAMCKKLLANPVMENYEIEVIG
jgi:phosphoribosylformylglycinamidine synthase subunit PurS